jgi:hypothetical protein
MSQGDERRIGAETRERAAQKQTEISATHRAGYRGWSALSLANRPPFCAECALMNKLLLSLLMMIALTASGALAQGKIALQPNDSLRSVLEQQVGKSVELRMKSGEKIAGKLEKVTDKLAHISHLTEADFYDAAVEIESVAAVVVRVRSN